MNPYLFFGIGMTVAILIQLGVLRYKFHFEKKITKKICRAGFKKRQLKEIELLYNSYKTIAKDQLIIAKLELQSKETSSSLIKDSFNILSSLFTGVFLVFSALMISTSAQMLDFVSGNDELKKDMDSWKNSLMVFSKNIADGINSMMIMVVLICVFSYLVILTLSVYNYKKNVIKKHLAIIEQAEKDRL